MAQKKKEKCLQVFQALDKDGDGVLTRSELAEIVEEEDLDGVMAKLDLDADDNVTFAEFFEGFDAFGGDDSDDEDEDGNPTIHGASISMGVIKAKEDERSEDFKRGLDESDDDEAQSEEEQREAKFRKILSWMFNSDQMIGVAEISQTITFLADREFTERETAKIKTHLIKENSLTVKSSIIANVVKGSQTTETIAARGNEWSNDRFITTFLEQVEMAVSSTGSASKKSASRDSAAGAESIADLSQANRQMHDKIVRLEKDVKKHKKIAGQLDRENQELRDKEGNNIEMQRRVENFEKQKADELKSYRSMLEQLQGDKQVLEKDLKNTETARQNDRALLKVKQSMIKNKTAENKAMTLRLNGLLQSHGERNKLELKKKIGKMTAIMSRRRFIRELQVDNERIPQLEVENARLKESVAKLQEEAKEYLRVMDSYRENERGEGHGLSMPPDAGPAMSVGFGDEEETEELRKRLKEEMEKVAQMKGELDDTLNILEEEKQGKETAQADLAETKTLLETEKAERKVQVESLTALVNESTAKIAQLETDLEAEKTARKNESEDYETKIAGLEDNIKDVSKQFEEETSRRKELEGQLNELGDDSQTKITDLTKEVAELKRNIKELEAELATEKTRREALEQQLETVQNELEEESKKRKELEDDLTQTKTELQDSSTKCSELAERMESMETEVVTIIEAKVFVEAKSGGGVDLGLNLGPDQQAELSAYTRCFNMHLAEDPMISYCMPCQENGTDLLSKLGDGLLIAKFINILSPDTIDERALNIPQGGRLKADEMLENLTLCVGSAKAVGIPIADEEKLIQNLVAPQEADILLDFLFALIKSKYLENVSVRRCEELLDLCENPDTGLSGLKLQEIETDSLQSMGPQDLLLRWINWHRIAEAAKPLEGELVDWGDDLADATAFSSVLCRIAECTMPDQPGLMPDTCKSDGKRARHVMEKAAKLGITHFHIPTNITGGNARLNTLFTACIFNCHTGIGDEEALRSGKSGSARRDQGGTCGSELSEEDREERAYRMWINSCGIPNCYVNNLFLDSRDGLNVLKLIDHIKPGTVDWKRVAKKPKGIFKKTGNCNLIIKYAKSPLNLNIKLIAGADIVEGNPKLIMAIMGQLMRYDTMLKLEKAFKKMGLKGGKNEESAILKWANDLVAKKPHDLNPMRKMKSFKDKGLSNSLFFFNLIWAIQPKLIKWKMVNSDPETVKDKTRNAGYVISVARKLGAEVYLLPHDIVECKQKQIMLFLGSVMSVVC